MKYYASGRIIEFDAIVQPYADAQATVMQVEEGAVCTRDALGNLYLARGAARDTNRFAGPLPWAKYIYVQYGS